MVKPAHAVLAAILLAGCGQGELPGHYWHVETVGKANNCTGDALADVEEFDYRAELDGNSLTLSVEDDIFATGIVDGCNFSYTSLVWSTYRENYEIEWQILGAARVNVGGGGGCVQGTDWQGVETFVITSSAHPNVAPGCTYDLDVTGKYVEEIVAPGNSE